MRGACARSFSVAATWVFALLQQSQQIEKSRSGELCAQPRRRVGDQVGGLDGDAQPHEVPIGHEDMAETLRGMADRQDGEASPEQRMSRIGYLDLVGRLIRRVLEQGIVLLSRLTTSTMTPCSKPSVTFPERN